MKRLTAAFSLFVLAALPLQAGKKHQIDLPDDFAASAEQMPVSRTFRVHAKVPMKFGTFQVVDHERGWERSRSESTPVVPPWFPVRGAHAVGAGKSSSRNSYSFTFADGGTPQWKVACLTRSENEEITVAGIPVRSEGSGDLVCRFAAADDETRLWTLAVHEASSLTSFRSTTSGDLSDGTTTLRIEPVTKYEGSDFKVPAAIGLMLVNEEEVIGAAELGSRGPIYLKAEGDLRSLTAAALAAILLND